MIAIQATTFSAIIQAAAAAVIAAFTITLAKATTDYVKATRDLVDEAREANSLQYEANRLTASSIAMAQGQAAPILTVMQDGRNVDDQRVEGILVVENRGGGPAQDVIVKSDWGDARADDSVLTAGSKTQAKARLSRGQWAKGTMPIPQRIEWTDNLGSHQADLIDGPPLWRPRPPS